MVQSAGGVLLHQLKELMLHTDLKRDDTIFYFTTCGWMMWNWLVSSLAVGATLVLYDGNPFHPGPGGPVADGRGRKNHRLRHQRRLYCRPEEGRGADRADEYRPVAAAGPSSPPVRRFPKRSFSSFTDEVKADLQLASISGGSDLNGCFALGNPMGPVYEGELQCRGLGMKVEAFDENGRPVIGRQGELVCTAPFPSMPIYFWDDRGRQKISGGLFREFPGVWTHGDFIEITERGGVIMYGRSDATLNPGGVRIGTAEIYRIIERIEEIEDSVVVGQEWQDDVRIILFVKMKAGCELTDDLQNRIRADIRTGASPRHVPAKIIRTPDIPYTLNMKKVELAVKKMIHGREVKNKDALKNPEALDFFAHVDELQR